MATLDTELKAAGVPTAPLAPSLARAYENSLLYSEHTFGYYGSQPGGFWYGDEWKQKLAEGKYARFLQSFDDKRAYIHTTENIVTNALAERMKLLAQNVAADGPRIVVFNPLPWAHSGEVEVPLPSGRLFRRARFVQRQDGGRGGGGRNHAALFRERRSARRLQDLSAGGGQSSDSGGSGPAA